jgi:sec-independent protein translocase protein TatA
MQLLAGIGPLGVPELLIIAFIIILIFGVGRLPEVGSALGKGIREFRKSTREDDDETKPDSGEGGEPPVATTAPPATEAAADVFCGECGAKNAGGTKFCAACGKELRAAVG